MRAGIVAAIALWLAGGCQATLAPRLGIGGAVPDFPIIVLAVLAPWLPRSGATVLGFFAGLVHGAVAGANLTAYAISRTLTGFGLGSMSSLELEPSVLLAMITAAIATLIAGLISLFLAPPPALTPFILATIGSAIYNGVLAAPAHLILGRLAFPRDP
ncbi:hypothetical protein EON81_12365 [bacterium]|nr:MAG: hypothetical protein EON81_12365 [bacterium]